MQMKPLVSVRSITYNHAAFIRQCVEGVLMQKTTFPFEYVIGEDCSTDGTREIVLEYAQKYPDIIRAITSESNVGAVENSRRSILACQGEFVASCEGDDYWIDPLKLQKQYDAITKYEAVLVAHGNFAVFYQDGKVESTSKIKRAKYGSGFLSLEDILTEKARVHTSSMFMRADIIKNLPDWFDQSPVGDFPLKVIYAYSGKVYYIDEIMSVYRKGVPGSYTDRKRMSKIIEDGKILELEKSHLQMFANLDTFTGKQYSNLIREQITLRHIKFYELQGNLDHLELGGTQKKLLRGIAILTKPFSQRLRQRILGKIVRYVEI
jgi:glycosyltransferase involved in cell wall biosynthesis